MTDKVWGGYDQFFIQRALTGVLFCIVVGKNSSRYVILCDLSKVQVGVNFSKWVVHPGASFLW